MWTQYIIGRHIMTCKGGGGGWLGLGYKWTECGERERKNTESAMH